MTTVDAAHMRKVGLSVPEIKVLEMLATRGEQMWKPEYAKQESRDLVTVLIDKGLVSCEQDTSNGRVYLRLTDQGRSVAAQLEAMAVKPKIEVVSG